MIMLSLTRAVTASVLAFAVIQATGCSGHGAAENRAAAYLAAVPAAVPGEENPSGSAGNGAALAAQASAERMMPPTGIELHHFNVYKNFRAMLDATSGAHGNDKLHRDQEQRSDAGTAYFACSGDALIKPED